MHAVASRRAAQRSSLPSAPLRSIHSECIVCSIASKIMQILMYSMYSSLEDCVALLRIEKAKQCKARRRLRPHGAARRGNCSKVPRFRCSFSTRLLSSGALSTIHSVLYYTHVHTSVQCTCASSSSSRACVQYVVDPRGRRARHHILLLPVYCILLCCCRRLRRCPLPVVAYDVYVLYYVYKFCTCNCTYVRVCTVFMDSIH